MRKCGLTQRADATLLAGGQLRASSLKSWSLDVS